MSSNLADDTSRMLHDTPFFKVVTTMAAPNMKRIHDPQERFNRAGSTLKNHFHGASHQMQSRLTLCIEAITRTLQPMGGWSTVWEATNS